MTNSPEYEASLEVHNAAAAVFAQVRKAHLAGAASDAEYFAARAVMNDADAVFDVAYAIEANRDPVTEIVAEDLQLTFAI